MSKKERNKICLICCSFLLLLSGCANNRIDGINLDKLPTQYQPDQCPQIKSYFERKGRVLYSRGDSDLVDKQPEDLLELLILSGVELDPSWQISSTAPIGIQTQEDKVVFYLIGVNGQQYTLPVSFTYVSEDKGIFKNSFSQHCIDYKLLRKLYRFHSNYSETFQETNEAIVIRMHEQNLRLSYRKHTLWRGGLIIPLRQTKIFDTQIEFRPIKGEI